MKNQFSYLRYVLILFVISVSFIKVTQCQTNLDIKALPFMSPDLPLPARVDDLVSRLTLEEKILQMQHTAPAIDRLGIPQYNWWNECLHGVARNGIATVFRKL